MYALDLVESDAPAFAAAVDGGRPYKPLYVKIKLFWSCNLRCGMCNHWREDRGPSLPLSRWRLIADELIALGCRKVHLSGGEPTLYPRLAELIATMSGRGLRVNMTTNGTLLTKARVKELVGAGLRGVNVSIDSPDRRLHDRIRGQKGAWKRTIKGVHRLRPRLKKGRLRINTVVGRINYRSLVDLPDLAAELGADAINLIPLDDHTGDLRRLNRRQIEEYNRWVGPVVAKKALALGLIDHPRQAFPFGLTRRLLRLSKRGDYALGFYEQRRCYAPWTHALINHRGQVTVCCMKRDAPVMGDLRSESMAAVWAGERYSALRGRRDLPHFDACRRCDDFLPENRRLAEIHQLKSEKRSSPASSS